MDKKRLSSIVITGAAQESLSTVPGGNTALNLIRAAINARAEQRATEIFTAIAVDLGASDWQAAARQMEEHSGKPWFDENIEAGFLELMDCKNFDARLCIGFLVSEHVINERRPDLNFKKVGSLLRECDTNILRALHSISEQYVNVANNERDGIRVLVRNIRRPDDSDTFWVCAFTYGQDNPTFSDRASCPESFKDATRLMTNSNIGHPWTGMSSRKFEGNPVLEFQINEDESVRLLHRCLSAWVEIETAI